jgi:hypothetical protein
VLVVDNVWIVLLLETWMGALVSPTMVRKECRSTCKSTSWSDPEVESRQAVIDYRIWR